ncbi:MAG TPA: hypothetical protein VLL52_13525 [Anaerolineae bacterium]|nr:hypothetical protein [Anaerolineae bacterium]
MTIQAITGTFYRLNDERQETNTAPGILTSPPQAGAARGRDEDTLFAHLTLTGSKFPPSLYQTLLQQFTTTFYKTTGTVTTALRTAVNHINQTLLQYNMNSRRNNVEGAFAAAVLHGQELFIIQVGDTFSLIGHSFGVESLPNQPPSRITPLGPSAGLDIRYYHHQVSPGMMLLLPEPHLHTIPPKNFAPALVNTEIELGVTKLGSIVKSGTARLLLIEFTEDSFIDLPDHITPMYAPSNRTTSNLSNLPIQQTARQATAQAALGLSRATDGLADALTQLRPPAPPNNYQDSPPNWALASFFAIIIPIIVAVIFTSVYFQRGQIILFSETRQNMNSSLGLGDQAYDNGDTTQAVTYYTEVLQLAATAEAIRPDDSDIARLRQDANQRLDRINSITRLYAQPLYTYPPGTLIRSIALGNEVTGDIYTLDSNNNVVYRHETDETYLNVTVDNSQIIIQNGQVIGNQVVGQLVDLMWRPRGNIVTRDGLTILDSRGLVLTYYPDFDQTDTAILGFASEWWRDPRNITSFNERLYVLDPAANQLWRYFPDANGFIVDEEQRAVNFDTDVNLTSATDVIIDPNDGSVIIAYENGALHRYVNGRQQWSPEELAANGLRAPLVTPNAIKITGSGPSSSIFIDDPGTSRLIQLSRRGNFLAQFKATDDSGRELLSLSRDFAVAENPLRVFFVSNNTLYVATQ